MFEEARIPFEVIPPDIDETMLDGETPEEFAVRAAGDKAITVATRLQQTGRRPWIVAADTIVVLDGNVLMKPKNSQDALRMLKTLSGVTHRVITGWAVGRHNDRFIADHAQTDVTFHDLSPQQIDAYVATKEGMDKAGAYAIQGIGAFLVKAIRGNYLNVVGLPLSLVIRDLLNVGALPCYPLPESTLC